MFIPRRIAPHFFQFVKLAVFGQHNVYDNVYIIDQYPLQFVFALVVVRVFAGAAFYFVLNGIGYGAPIRLDTIEVGPIRLTDVAASVNQAPMDRSLLGMTFLRRLSAYEVRGDSLTLWR